MNRLGVAGTILSERFQPIKTGTISFFGGRIIAFVTRPDPLSIVLQNGSGGECVSSTQ